MFYNSDCSIIQTVHEFRWTLPQMNQMSLYSRQPHLKFCSVEGTTLSEGDVTPRRDNWLLGRGNKASGFPHSTDTQAVYSTPAPFKLHRLLRGKMLLGDNKKQRWINLGKKRKQRGHWRRVGWGSESLIIHCLRQPMYKV